MLMHKKHEPFDSNVHWLLGTTMWASASFIWLQLQHPSSLWLALGRASSCLMQGIWLWQARGPPVSACALHLRHGTQTACFPPDSDLRLPQPLVPCSSPVVTAAPACRRIQLSTAGCKGKANGGWLFGADRGLHVQREARVEVQRTGTGGGVHHDGTRGVCHAPAGGCAGAAGRLAGGPVVDGSHAAGLPAAAPGEAACPGPTRPAGLEVERLPSRACPISLGSKRQSSACMGQASHEVLVRVAAAFC